MLTRRLFLILLMVSFSTIELVSRDIVDYSNLSIQNLTSLAEKNDHEAQYYLGTLYDEGKDVPQNYKLAAKWYHKAAEQDDPYAQYNLGRMYYYGRGVTLSYERAYFWILIASRNGPWSLTSTVILAQNIVEKKFTPDETYRIRREAQGWVWMHKYKHVIQFDTNP